MALEASAAEAEVARARLLELFPGGFEELETAGGVELAVYTDGAGEMLLRRAFARVSSVPVEPDWAHRWREFHQPVRAGGIWIGPPWIEAPTDEPTVVVDPGRAFGTGAHPTTRACIELLSTLPRGSVYDAGCGSGVVAVAAARLGFAPVWAVDVDPVAVDVALATIRINAADVRVSQADALGEDPPRADVVVANIELRVVEQLLRKVRAPLAVTAGYLAGEEPTAPGWEVRTRLELDGWAAHVLAPAGH